MLEVRPAEEGPALVARLDPRLRFTRNYEASLRPYAPYCEERIAFVEVVAPDYQ